MYLHAFFIKHTKIYIAQYLFQKKPNPWFSITIDFIEYLQTVQDPKIMDLKHLHLSSTYYGAGKFSVQTQKIPLARESGSSHKQIIYGKSP